MVEQRNGSCEKASGLADASRSIAIAVPLPGVALSAVVSVSVMSYDSALGPICVVPQSMYRPRGIPFSLPRELEAAVPDGVRLRIEEADRHSDRVEDGGKAFHTRSTEYENSVRRSDGGM